MSEDVSSQVRLGATIILVAALIAAVLSLMVVAQTILANGMSTLQTGASQISAQEFDKYNNKKISGTEVKSAMSLYAGRDLALVVRTSSCKERSIYNVEDGDKDGSNNMNYIPWAYNYGALLSKDAIWTSSDVLQAGTDGTGIPIGAKVDGVYPKSKVYGIWQDPNKIAAGGQAVAYTFCGDKNSGGVSQPNSDTSLQAPITTESDIWREVGGANYISYYAEENGKIQSNFEFSNTTKVSSPEYIIDSGVFQCTLIKTPGGTIIGILFEQM